MSCDGIRAGPEDVLIQRLRRDLADVTLLASDLAAKAERVEREASPAALLELRASVQAWLAYRRQVQP